MSASPSNSAPADALSADAEALYCPHCSYDLRHTPSARCPECGMAFDRGRLAVSQLAWAQRREMGRVRAFVRTVYFVMAHPAELAREIALSADWKSASSFRWVCVGVTAVLIAAWVCTLGLYAIQIRDLRFSIGYRFDDGVALWMLPFFGALFSYASFGVVPVALVLGLGSATWFVRASFWAVTGALRGRASTVALYLTAWILPTALLLVCDSYVMWIADRFHLNLRGFETYILMVLIPHLFLLVAGPVACLRVLHRATFSSFTRTVLASIFIPSGALLIFVLSTTAAVYAMGLVLIMLRSVIP
jgi:hypothetical protein